MLVEKYLHITHDIHSYLLHYSRLHLYVMITLKYPPLLQNTSVEIREMEKVCEMALRTENKEKLNSQPITWRKNLPAE